MTGGEKVAVGVGVVAVAGVAGYALWKHLQRNRAVTQLTGQPARAGSTNTVGNIIAGIGGSAVAQLGKEAGSYLADRLESAFS
jgi:hypothetical protein